MIPSRGHICKHEKACDGQEIFKERATILNNETSDPAGRVGHLAAPIQQELMFVTG